MGTLDRFDDFCGLNLPPENPYGSTQFWRRQSYCTLHGLNSTTSCHDRVDISVCFEDTAVLIGICTLFWLLAGIKFLILNGVKSSLPLSKLHICKLVLVAVPFLTAVCDLGYTIYQGRTGAVAQFLYLSPAMLVATMIIVVLVMWQERNDGVRSSGLFFIFWLCLTFYAGFKLRSLILIAKDYNGIRDKFRFTTFCFQFAAYLLQLVLVVIPEPPSRRTYHAEDEKRPCPEESATFLSRITWWWLNGLVWRGWRVALEYKDLSDLNREDKSEMVATAFQRNWDKEVLKSRGGVGGVRLEEHTYQPINTQNINTGVQVITVRGRRKKKEPSLVWALAKTFWEIFIAAAFFKFVQDLLNFVSPQVLRWMILYTQNESEADWRGYMYAVLLFVTAVIQSLFLHQYFHRCFTLGMRIRSAIIAAVYKKALNLNNRARQTKTVGEIVNLMSVDAQRFMDLMTYIHMIWSAPLQIILSLLFLYFTMGYSIFAGFVVMVLMIPLNAVIASISRRFQVKQMSFKDTRIKLVNEVLNGIKVIKLYAWEIPFQRQVMGIRKQELSVLRASAYLNAASSFSWTCAPFIVSLATFATYALVNLNNPHERLTAEKAFVALSLFNILRFPLSMLPMLISNLVQASVSVKRVAEFLRSEELDPNIVNWRPEPAMEHEDAISVVGGTFKWEVGPAEAGENEDSERVEDRDERATLSNLDIHIKRGQLVAVVGQVGAGKSSLISALLGEMEKMAGSVSVRGKVAYVPQQAWIQNATVQGNILFGRPMQGTWYTQTLTSCALEPDLEILPGGDKTEIGEKGINLSGGQKQRVSLARAVYQKADIYLLDDPLSAVDSHVGKHIFEKVIGPDGMLKGKTRVLVTHGISFLPQCDQIIVLDGGRVSEVGSYAELIDADGAFAEFIRTYTGTGEDEEGDPMMSEYSEYDEGELELEQRATPIDHILSDDPETFAHEQARKKHLQRSRSRGSESSMRDKAELRKHSSKTDLHRQLSRQKSVEAGEKAVSPPPTERTALILEERVEKGSVRPSVILAYIRACTYPAAVITLLMYILSSGASLASNFWLADWSNSQNNGAHSNITVTACDTLGTDAATTGCYLGVYGALGLTQAIFIVFAAFGLAISAVLASKTLHNSMLKNILRSPMSFFDTTPLGRILNRFSKDTYIIDEVIPRSLRSFIFTFLIVVNTLIVIIITTPPFAIVIVPLFFFYGMVQRFYVATSRQLKRLESTSRSPIYSHFQESIMGVTSIRAYRQQERFMLESEDRVDYNQIAYYPSICSNRWLAIRLEFVGNLIIFFAALFAVIQRNYHDTIHIRINPGLVGLSISYALQVTQALNWVVRMTSEMETNIVAVERLKEYSETPTEAPAIIPSNRPPQNWPADGHVHFDHYSTRYREGLALVLRDISVDVPGGTKVGIVGRTGAGKSSLTLALFRIIESAGGAIKVDNIPIDSIGLTDLRSKLTIIPQDPVLFSGSLRMNLDPFDQYSDEDVWKSLESAHLKNFVSSLTGTLQYTIAEGGENLSVGQRQLVCLARALLRKTKILVLDEATAAVDLETDDLIQKTIRTEFADCTILTIAHRINTIMDYDYVMLLDNGRTVEYSPPGELLSNKKSSFYAMAKDAGIVG